MKTALVIGGSSGLGLEMAKQLQKTHDVCVTGRRDPEVAHLGFRRLELTDSARISERVDRILDDSPRIDLLIYSPGFYQEGSITALSDLQIVQMMEVGVIGAAFILRAILERQEKLAAFIAITSTSQWTPREKEPVYTAAKAALGMLANSISLDPRVEKTLVAGPAGMNTPFWRDSPRDTTTFLDPHWVAEEILKENEDAFKYKFVRIMRNPARTELVEKR